MLIIIMNSKIEFKLQNDIHPVDSNSMWPCAEHDLEVISNMFRVLFIPFFRSQWCQCYVGDFMMVTDLRCWWQNHYIDDYILSPTAKLVTNTFCLKHPSPTSMSPFFWRNKISRKIVTDRNERSSLLRKCAMIDYFKFDTERKFCHFSAKLTWKWRNYIILNNCIKIFHFKYFYCDEIILILFSPLLTHCRLSNCKFQYACDRIAGKNRSLSVHWPMNREDRKFFGEKPLEGWSLEGMNREGIKILEGDKLSQRKK